jgi:hypothetical protein
LEAALKSVGMFEELRCQFEAEDDKEGLAHLVNYARELKASLELTARSAVAENRVLAKEVLQWLTIWLQNPLIFADWLSLRRRSADFVRRFGP